MFFFCMYMFDYDSFMRNYAFLQSNSSHRNMLSKYLLVLVIDIDGNIMVY